MLSMLLAYDDQGDVIATLDHLVAYDDDGNVIGLIDFAAHEEAGGKLRDVWDVEGAAGSSSWPEWIGARAHDFRVELDDSNRVTALVHRNSGHRRDRAAIEASIAARLADGRRMPDLRDVVGGPDRPLLLDDQGRTANRSAVPGATRLGLARIERPE